MMSSMTGYGRAFCESKSRNFTVEIKSVNHRYLDLNIKMPRSLLALEDRIRKAVQGSISRGKVDIYITQTVLETENSKALFNKNLCDSYVKCLNEIRELYNIKDDISLSLISKFPDVITVEEKDEDVEDIWEVLKKPLKEALDTLILMRRREGESLKGDIEKKCTDIKVLVDSIDDKSRNLVDNYKVKLNNRINELISDKNLIDENRIAMEVAIFSDKACIDEEIVRLRSHISQLSESIEISKPVGRKLDFIVQEMNREANTIASKASDVNIVHLVLDIKNDIEKIREQIQNIE
ncbi:TIGR00255 family protein [Clostridium acidisoli DSM 12555]|uniref:TIGR00255 family protein n=1 Tax=Clostridium acidisoli DSM 12555 TaxID=1121291 RepID=A0A1W1XCP1_9CLOT|nr:YicC/YloC family endoribonuclease [Clostridium acidisoli]SMC21574.1 TIGR00255 family protein [Clostridium acidisoli DSM 12555]